MKNSKSRRDFIGKFAFASAGVILFPAEALCNSALRRMHNGVYLYEMDSRSSLFETKTVCIQGKVFDKNGTGISSDALIEILSSEKGYSLGKVLVNDRGEYRIKANYPEKGIGKAARLYFRVTSPGNSYETELIVNDLGAHISDKHWEINHGLGEKLFPIKTDYRTTSEILFNLSI